MRRTLDAAMNAGALGLSTGLEYEAGSFATTDELADLAGVIALQRGIYASHIRNRDARLAEAVDEFMTVSRAAGGRGQLSHLNVRYNTGASEGAWKRAVETLERERAVGMDVLADATPMTTGDGVMAGILPPWLLADGPARAAALLRDPAVRRRVRADCDRYWRFIARGEWERVRLLSSRDYPELCGLTFPEIAERLGVDEWDAYFDILAAAGDEPRRSVSDRDALHRRDVSGARPPSPVPPGRRHDEQPYRRSAEPPDTQPAPFRRPHALPRPSRAGRADAVARGGDPQMTSMVATRFELRDRGLLRAGAFADVAVFDPDRLAECSTIEHPLAYAIGFEQVFVNGVAVIVNGQHTGARPGRFLAAVH